MLIIMTLNLFVSKENNIYKKIESLSEKIENEVIKWRHHIHQNPELSNREYNTAKYVAAHLKKLGLEVTENVAYTGVVAVLNGGKPGKTVALRADMDALPVTERVDIPFASKVKTIYKDTEVGVMHACGHDTHVAILMGVASVLTELKKEIKGKVKFVFQPAEEGPPEGEEGGAELMVKEGVLKNPDVDAIFGLHINSFLEVNKIGYKPGGTLASATSFEIKIKGKQAHGSAPWSGADPIVAGAQIINNLQTIVSRNLDLTNEAAVVTIGRFESGIRSNIIPDVVEMEGTIRTFDSSIRDTIFSEMRNIAEKTAEMAGASVEVYLPNGQSYPVTYNDEDLTTRVLPSLKKIVGEEGIVRSGRSTGAEDFSFFSQEVPGFYFFLGVNKPDADPFKTAGNHSPFFYIDDSALPVGVKALSHLTIEYLNGEI